MHLCTTLAYPDEVDVAYFCPSIPFEMMMLIVMMISFDKMELEIVHHAVLRLLQLLIHYKAPPLCSLEVYVVADVDYVIPKHIPRKRTHTLLPLQ